MLKLAKNKTWTVLLCTVAVISTYYLQYCGPVQTVLSQWFILHRYVPLTPATSVNVFWKVLCYTHLLASSLQYCSVSQALSCLINTNSFKASFLQRAVRSLSLKRHWSFSSKHPFESVWWDSRKFNTNCFKATSSNFIVCSLPTIHF